MKRVESGIEHRGTSRYARWAPPVDRRAFCSSLIAGAGLAGLGVVPGLAAAPARLNLDRDADLLRALIKMRGSLDSRLVIGWLRARRFAVSVGRVEPLCGVLAATFYRFKEVSDELFEATALEISYYTDVRSGELLEELIMPFTGKRVTVPAYRFGPAATRFAVQLEEQEDFEPAAGTTESEFAPTASVLMSKSIHREGSQHGELSLRHEEYGRVLPQDGTVQSMFYKESTIWSAPLEAVLHPGNDSVDARVAYSAVTSWRPWMQMEDQPGFTSSNGFGGKARSVADLPEDFLRFTARHHPDVLEDPAALLGL